MSTFAYSFNLDEFKASSLKIDANMNELAVRSLMGSPDKIEPATWKDVIELGGDKGLSYFHPEYATVHLLVAFKDGMVSGVSICTAVGSRVWTTECQKPLEYWADN